jgi:hypothetical protein
VCVGKVVEVEVWSTSGRRIVRQQRKRNRTQVLAETWNFSLGVQFSRVPCPVWWCSAGSDLQRRYDFASGASTTGVPLPYRNSTVMATQFLLQCSGVDEWAWRGIGTLSISDATATSGLFLQ